MFIVYYVTCFIIIAAALLLAGLSSLLGFILKWEAKTSILVGIGTFFFLMCGVFGYQVYRENDFYGYGGDFDYWRTPLDYPYEITMIDVTDCGHITRWKDGGFIVAGITHYHKQDNIIVGKSSSTCFPHEKSEWFSFDTTTGIATEYETKAEYQQALKELGFSEEPELLTLEENVRLYWDKYRKRGIK